MRIRRFPTKQVINKYPELKIFKLYMKNEEKLNRNSKIGNFIFSAEEQYVQLSISRKELGLF